MESGTAETATILPRLPQSLAVQLFAGATPHHLPPERHAVLMRRERAQRVAHARLLHFQHVGAEIGEESRRERSRHDRGDVQDAQARERARGCAAGRVGLRHAMRLSQKVNAPD